MDVATLTEAIVILGFNTLRSLVIAASMRSLYVQKPSRQGAETAARFAARQKTLWEHSVACAAVSRKLAKKINYANPETAFVAGLLHDIGRLVMFKEMPAESERWLAERNPAADTPQPPAQKILASEKEIFSFDHSQVGTAVARKWQLAEELTSAIAGHHFAETATPPTPLGAIVDFANTICLKNRIGPIAMPALNLEEELARLPLALTAQDLKTVQDDLSRMLSAEALFL
jgi:putative nucleotidyltransferase with HDIG domain